MSSRYIIYYQNLYYFVALAGDVTLRYEVRAKANPNRVVAHFDDFEDPLAADKAIDDADERDQLALEEAEAKRDAEELRRPSRKRGKRTDEQE